MKKGVLSFLSLFVISFLFAGLNISSAQGFEVMTEWERSDEGQNKPAWFDGNQRGLAYVEENDNEYVLIASSTLPWVGDSYWNVRIVNAATGDDAGELDLTNYDDTGGTFHISDVATSEDGKIFVSNYAEVDDHGAFRVQMFENTQDDEPAMVLEDDRIAGEGWRYARIINITGNYDDGTATLYVVSTPAAEDDPQNEAVLRFTQTGQGENFSDDADIIEMEDIGTNPNSSAAMTGADDFYWTADGRAVYKLDSEGNEIGQIPGEVLGNATINIQFIDSNNGNDYIAVVNTDNSSAELVRVVNGNPEEAELVASTPSLGDALPFAGLGDLHFLRTDNGFDAYVMSSDRGIGHYEVVETFTVHYNNELGWDQVFTYAFDADQEEDNWYIPWPGESMSPPEEGTPWYSYEIPANFDTVIFNDGYGGEGGQTDDLVRNEDGWYDGTQWFDEDDFEIQWANLQSPPEADILLGQSIDVFGQVWIPVITAGTKDVEELEAWIGVSDQGGNPENWDPAVWQEMELNQPGSEGNNDEFMAEISPDEAGEYYYATRYQYEGGEYIYGGYSDDGGGPWDGETNVSGQLTVETVPIEAFSLLSPENETVIELTNPTEELNLEWEEAESDQEVTYRVYVSDSPNFDSNGYLTTQETSLTLSNQSYLDAGLGWFENIPKGGEFDFHWKVEAVIDDEEDGEVTRESEERWHFTLKRPETVLEDDAIVQYPIRAEAHDYASRLAEEGSWGFFEDQENDYPSEYNHVMELPEMAGELQPEETENVSATELSVSQDEISTLLDQVFLPPADPPIDGDETLELPASSWNGYLPVARSPGGWEAESPEDAKYYEFEVSADEGYEMFPEQISFEHRVAGSSPSYITVFLNGKEVETIDISANDGVQVETIDLSEINTTDDFEIPDGGYEQINIQFAGWGMLQEAFGQEETISEIGGDWLVNDFKLYGDVILTDAEIAEFNLLSPENEDTLLVEGESFQEIEATWEEAESGVDVYYEWIASASPDFPEDETITIEADDGGFDNMLTLTFGELDELLEDLGVEQGESIDLYWRVDASNELLTKSSEQVWQLTLERGEIFPGVIEFANLQSPFEAEIVMGHSATVYGRVLVTEELTHGRQEVEDLRAWVGVSSSDTHPSEWSDSAWREMEFDESMSNFEYDQFKGRVSATERGEKYFATRYQLREQEYEYGGISEAEDVLGLDRRTRGGFWGDENVSGKLTVTTVPGDPVDMVVDNLAELIDEGEEGDLIKIANEVITTFIYQGDELNRHFISDGTGALVIHDTEEVLEDAFAIGDGMEGLRGKLKIDDSQTRYLVPEENPGVSSEANQLPVYELELADFDADEHQSWLVDVHEASFTDEGEFEDSTFYNVMDPTLNAGSEENNDEQNGGARFTTYEFVDSLDYIGSEIPDEEIILRAIVTEDEGTPQLTARSIEDFMDIPDPLQLEFANLQWPAEIELTSGEAETAYGRVYIPEETEGDAEVEGLTAELGVHDENTDPSEWGGGAWAAMEFNAAGSDADFDEYMAEVDETVPGSYYYATRFYSADGDTVYGGISDEEDQLGLGDDTRGGIWDGEDNVSGELTVEAVEVEHIAELLEVGEVGSDINYTITGEVYLVFNSDFRNRKVVVDPTGGIVLDDFTENLSTEFNRYDGLTGLTGSLGEFNNLVQFEPSMDMEASSSDNDIYPDRVTSLAEIDSTRQGELVYVEEVTFQETGEFEDQTDYTIEDGEGNELTMRTDRVDEDQIFDEGEQTHVGTAIPEEPVNLVGYVGVFFDPQLVVRKLDDIIAADAISPFALDFPGDGETIEVEGGENEEVSITWEAAESEEDVVYNWIAQEPGLMYKPASFDLAADEDGAEPSLTFTLSELDMFLDAAGVDEGGQATMEWTVVAAATEGHAFRYADETRTVTLERGMVTSSEEMAEVPEEVGLDQNYPNPFNPVTTIGYQLPSDTHVELTVYNTLGQQVKTLVDERIQAGTHEVSFDASELSSGVYIYRLQADGEVITNQMTLVK